MGYSARYHAASLAAVFLALAIGILIGVGFGGDLLKGAKKDLEASLKGDLNAARSRSADLASQLNRSDEFGQRVYPSLVGDRLAGKRIGVLGLGGLPQGISGNVEDALAPTGAKLSAVAVLREPPDVPGIAAEIGPTRFARIRQDPALLDAFTRILGRQLINGGALLTKLRPQLFSRASGRLGALDGLIVVRDQPANLTPHEQAQTAQLEGGMLAGAVRAGAPAVGVEQTTTDPSSTGFFADSGSASVDDVDDVSGQVAMVFALLGAEGQFGVKEGADRLLPDLLAPSPRRASG